MINDKERKTAVHLRAMEPEDLELLYQIENNPSLWKVGVTNVPYSRYQLRDYLARSTGDIYTDRQVRMVVENGEGVAIGLIDMMNYEPQHHRAEVGIVIREPFRHQGFGTEALEQLKQYARDIVHLHQLFAYVDMENEESLRLFQKAGFERSAILNDWLFDGHDYHPVCFMQLFF